MRSMHAVWCCKYSEDRHYIIIYHNIYYEYTMSKMQDASSNNTMSKNICMGEGSTESTCCLDPKAWCLADGCKYSYDFDGLSGNSTLELWRCMWRAVSSRHLDFVKTKVGKPHCNTNLITVSGGSSNKLGWDVSFSWGYVFFHWLCQLLQLSWRSCWLPHRSLVFLVLFSHLQTLRWMLSHVKRFTAFLPGLWPGFCGDLSSGRPHAEHLCGSWASGVRRGLYHTIYNVKLVGFWRHQGFVDR